MKKYSLINIFLITTAITTGCVSQNATMPNLNTELHYNQEIQNNYKRDQLWWKNYQDEQLNKLIDLALTNNPDYIKSALSVNKELYNLNIQQSDLFPTLHSSLGLQSQKRLYDNKQHSENFSGELGLNYELDLYGKISDKVSAEKMEYKASKQDLESAKLTLINSVIDLYFNLSYLQNIISLSEENIEAYKNILKIMQNTYKYGKSDKLQVLQAEKALIAEQNNLISAQTQFKEMEQNLHNILNIQDSENFNIKYHQLLEQNLLPVDLDIPTSVLANRPDLQAKQYRLEKSFINMNVQEKNWYPSVSLSGLIASSSDKGRTTFDFPYLAGNISVNLPFLDWNRVKNNIRISKTDYEIAVVDFKQTLTQAINELSYYKYAYEQSKLSYTNNEKNVKNNGEITKFYKIRYDNGKAEFKDLLEAIYSENTSRKNLIQQKYQIIKYENYIYKSMAGKYTKA